MIYIIYKYINNEQTFPQSQKAGARINPHNPK